MTVTPNGQFLAALCFFLGLVVPIPSFSAPPDFFESLRNESDTEPADTVPTPSFRKVPSDTNVPRGPASPRTGLPSPEVRSSRDRDRSDTSLLVIIPPSNATFRSGDTGSVSPSPGNSSSRRASDTGVRFSRAGRVFDEHFFIGMRWPGLSFGFRESPYTLEVKYLEESDDVKITGLWLYHHLLRMDATNVYWGLDLARVS